jgi:hypothetical protein
MQLNPYESPKITEAPITAASSQWLLTCVQIIGIGTPIGALVSVGAFAFFAWDSPEYFTATMRADDLWIKAFLKRALAGAVFGALLSGIFIVVAGLITRRQITYAKATEKLLWIAVGAVSLSYVAGTIAVMFADGFPGPMREFLPMAPDDPRRFFRFAFVTVSSYVLPWSAALFGAIHLYMLYREERRKTTNRAASD